MLSLPHLPAAGASSQRRLFDGASYLDEQKSPPCGGALFTGTGCRDYARVFRTSCSGTEASMARGAPSTHWMAFLGHLLTQVPQPLHLV